MRAIVWVLIEVQFHFLKFLSNKTYSETQWFSKTVLYLTLLGITTTGLLTTGETMVRERYGEIAQNPPYFPDRYFTGVQTFSFEILKFVLDVNSPFFSEFLQWDKWASKFMHRLNLEHK